MRLDLRVNKELLVILSICFPFLYSCW